MIYDTVVIDGEMAEHKAQNKKILLEIEKNDGIFELTLADRTGSVEWIHTNRVIIQSYSGKKEADIVSLYEVLWAAKVQFIEQSLYPAVDENHETSIQNLFVYQEESAV